MIGRPFWRRAIKVLHEIAAVGGGGGLAACLIIGATANAGSALELAVARHEMAAISRYLLVPSLALVLVTGLLALIATRAYLDAGWAWLKAALGLSIFEGTLVTVGTNSQQATLAEAASNATLLASMWHSERNTMWLLLGLSVANVVLAVWRPRLTVKIRT